MRKFVMATLIAGALVGSAKADVLATPETVEITKACTALSQVQAQRYILLARLLSTAASPEAEGNKTVTMIAMAATNASTLYARQSALLQSFATDVLKQDQSFTSDVIALTSSQVAKLLDALVVHPDPAVVSALDERQTACFRFITQTVLPAIKEQSGQDQQTTEE